MMKRSQLIFTITIILMMIWGIYFWPKSDPNTFWSAIEALFTALAAAYLIFEFPRLKREEAKGNLEGLRLTKEIIESSEFQAQIEIFGKHFHNRDLPGSSSHIGLSIEYILEQLDIIALLIENNSLDQDLFYRHYGVRLHLLAENLIKIKSGEFPELSSDLVSSSRFPRAIELLRAINQSSY